MGSPPPPRRFHDLEAFRRPACPDPKVRATPTGLDALPGPPPRAVPIVQARSRRTRTQLQSRGTRTRTQPRRTRPVVGSHGLLPSRCDPEGSPRSGWLPKAPPGEIGIPLLGLFRPFNALDDRVRFTRVCLTRHVPPSEFLTPSTVFAPAAPRPRGPLSFLGFVRPAHRSRLARSPTRCRKTTTRRRGAWFAMLLVPEL
jgi:hypothetical protein